MTKQQLLSAIKDDLGSNYSETSDALLQLILDDVITDALFVSNRRFKVSQEYEHSIDPQLDILSTEIKKAVKTIYLQRGAEDVNSNSQSGISSSYDDAMKRMREDIIKNGKRIMA